MKFWNTFNANRKLFSTLRVDGIEKKKIYPFFFYITMYIYISFSFSLSVHRYRWKMKSPTLSSSIPRMFTRLHFTFHVRGEMQTRVYEMAHNGMESKMKNLRRRFEAKGSFEFTREYETRVTHLSKIYFPFDLISLLYYFIAQKWNFLRKIYTIHRWKEKVSQDCTEARVFQMFSRLSWHHTLHNNRRAIIWYL